MASFTRGGALHPRCDKSDWNLGASLSLAARSDLCFSHIVVFLLGEIHGIAPEDAGLGAEATRPGAQAHLAPARAIGRCWPLLCAIQDAAVKFRE